MGKIGNQDAITEGLCTLKADTSSAGAAGTTYHGRIVHTEIDSVVDNARHTG